MAIVWNTIETAIAYWARTGSGLPTGKVIWAKQNGPRPANPYIALSILAIQRTGHDHVNVEDNPSPASGAEIIHYVRGPRKITVTMQCFSNTALGISGSAQILDSVMSAVKLPSVQDALRTAGVGVASFDPIQPLGSAMNSAVFEPRALLTARCFIASEISETGTYIETVEATNDPPWSA